MKSETLYAQYCVIGGGLAGMAAAITAARRGVKTILVHDRPMLGGNCSSEIRMWICGSLEFMETGFVEELRLENFYRNPDANYSIWDSVLYGKAIAEPNLTLLLNASCCGAEMKGNRIASVDVWQLTTYTKYKICAGYFADCSGDSILAEPTGADYRVGHEARREYGESIAPENADRKTMGMSCLIQLRETESPQKFIPPDWAYRYESEDALPERIHDLKHELSEFENFWYLELGGEDDSIHDTEKVRDELLKVALGVWDHIKNRGDHGADNWTLEWLGFLPGKRESRRYMGDHVMDQHDVESGGRFDDIVAYGGWSMDDHHPAGFRYPGSPNVHYPAPPDFGIPYRSLYSRNVENLWFAGRNISVTHVALSSTRVMATCACMGEAVGMAAALAVKNALTPREVGQKCIGELQQLLLRNDCYLPGIELENTPVCAGAALKASAGNAELLRSGRIRGENGAWSGTCGDWAEYIFEEPAMVNEVRLVLDSDVERRIKSIPSRLNMRAHRPLHMDFPGVPETLAGKFRITAVDAGGNEHILLETDKNCQRLITLPIGMLCRKVRMEILDEKRVRVLGFRVY